MLTRSIDVMRYVRASAGRSSLNVVFEEENHPRHDGKTIYLPRVGVHTTEDQLLEMMSSTDHEVAHDLYSDFDILQEKHIDPSKSKLGFIWNLIEDSRVNVLEAVEYEGFRELWEQTTPKLLESIKKTTVGTEPLSVIIRSLIKWEGVASRSTFPLIAQTASEFDTVPKIDDILSKFTERLQGTQKILDKKPGSTATYELARDIFRALGGDPDEEERKAKEAAGKTGKPGETGEETDEEAEDGSPGSESEDESDEKKKAKERGEEDWCIKKVKLKDLDKKMLTIHTPKSSHMSKVGLLHDSVIDYDSEWVMTPIENFILVDYGNNTCSNSSTSDMLDTSHSSTSWFINNFDKRVRGKAVTAENFAQQVRRLIQIRSRVKYQYGVKKGKLDFARLARIVSKQPGYSERVFKNKINNTVLDAAVTILLDMSGSMSGDKVFFSAEATMLLNNVFKVLQVPLEILGFTDYGIPPVGYIYKTFNKPRISEDTLLSYIGASSNYMSGNPDGDCILWAYDRLLHRKEKKRLLLVMSDGQPAASRLTHGCTGFTKKAIEEIEKARKVDIYGLGLCDTSVSYYYKNHSTVTCPEEIPTKLLQLIEGQLLNV